jgi:AMMECR1 domain-containing protein
VGARTRARPRQRGPSCDKPTAFRPGIDGIVVDRHGRRALLLPEVAPMLDLDCEGMLQAACRKAGLSVNAWREPGTTVQVFRTARFGRPALAAAG